MPLVRAHRAASRCGRRRGPAQRLASTRLAQFNEARIEDISQSGLHEYIQSFLGENGRLGQAIHDQYLS